MRRLIEERTAGLPDGCSVRLDNVPQWEVAPFYFGWALQSALKRPFSPSDLAARCTVIEPENIRLNRYRFAVPERYDLELAFDPAAWGITRADRERWLSRLVREGVIAEPD
jgi:hypothetical protein